MDEITTSLSLYNDSNNKPLVNIIAAVSSLPQTAQFFESFFTTDIGELQDALNLIGFKDTLDLLSTSGNYFQESIQLDTLTIEEIEKLDIRNIAYQFIRKYKISIPITATIEERQTAIQMLCKVGRVFLHEILFPFLNSSNPTFAWSVKSMLERTITNICKVEGYRKEEVFDLLQIDELSVSRPIGFLQPTQGSKTHGPPSKCFVCQYVTPEQVTKLALMLYTQYEVLKSWKPFMELLTTSGKEVDYVKVHPEKLRVLIRIMYCLNKAKENPAKKQILKMNIGKGYWKHLQQFIIDGDTGFQFKRALHKMSSETNSSPEKYKDVFQEANSIIIKFLQSN